MDEASALKEADYTAETWTVFAAALADAQAVLANDEATQAQVDNALTALNAAVEQLEKVQEPGQEANKLLLQKTYDYALTLDTTGVVDSAVAVFQKAMDEAKAVLDNPNATQDEGGTHRQG